ncbi:hypothetical protein M231_00427 [Tremella mesenterica]|uniref:Mitochondrial protein n=1 Tax=Tremella mesenterica TaxID=5217 RepID=A0A4V1M530_TREME|nr:hypothetical protein M231_00427 [Tremella mesenterica]
MISRAGPSRLSHHLPSPCPRYLRNVVATYLTPTTRPLSSSSSKLSGHSRWSKIRHKKGAVDAQRSVLFSKLTNDIHTALRPPNSSDPNLNPRLATAIARARDGGVPLRNIEGAFARAKAAADGSGQNVIYEAVGPGGFGALIIECMTDNPTRTFARVRDMLNKNGYRIAPVAYLFEKKGLIIISISNGGTYDHLFEIALEAGAEDVKEIDSAIGGEKEYEIIVPPTELSSCVQILSRYSDKYTIQSSELARLPLEPLIEEIVMTENEDGSEKIDGLERMINLLEEETDVVRVWSNLS